MHIYDDEFIRGPLPMTKQEVRAVSIAKLELKEDDILIDVGAGTGTIGIEAATYLKKGKVIGIEKENKGINVIKQNIEKFKLNNYILINGIAPQDIPKIEYDAMFIGGSSKNLESIVEHFHKYSKSGARLVVNAITLETLLKIKQILEDYGYEKIEIVQLSISRNKKILNYNMMYGENPIYIIKITKLEA